MVQATKDSPSRFGQLIGEAFERAVIQHVRKYLLSDHPDYEIAEGKNRLRMSGGSVRSIDTIIADRLSTDPIGLLESKWLKDQRHHIDKGAWILQLREVKKQHPTVRGAIAILAGFWTEAVGVALLSEGGVKMIHVATDQEVYDTLQPHFDRLFPDERFVLDARVLRKKYPNPGKLMELAEYLSKEGILDELAKDWLRFVKVSAAGQQVQGVTLINSALNELLAPLPANPTIFKYEISLQISSGNVIYAEFSDYESATEFLENYFRNPQAVLKKIAPKR